MIYYSVKMEPSFKSISFEEFLFGDPKPALISMNQACTRTYSMNRPNEDLLSKFDIQKLILILENFTASGAHLRSADRKSLYRTFTIPKKSGGRRTIDAPCEQLKAYQRVLKSILEENFQALYHTSAFAYVKGRCALDAVKRHQANESKWFAKFDFSNFFGSTTKEFVMEMLAKVFPFSEVCRTERGYNALNTAIDIAFLNGVLPQGTPLSPLLTNIMMIPIDYTLSNKLRNHKDQRYIYTRYADDILISAEYKFEVNNMEAEVNGVLQEFHAPFRIKPEKTRFGSSSGRNWNLGVMLNRNNEITIGAENKRRFKAKVTSFVLDTKNGNSWDKTEVMRLDGLMNYYRSIEGDNIRDILKKIGDKFNVNVTKMMKVCLRV